MLSYHWPNGCSQLHECARAFEAGCAQTSRRLLRCPVYNAASRCKVKLRFAEDDTTVGLNNDGSKSHSSSFINSSAGHTSTDLQGAVLRTWLETKDKRKTRLTYFLFAFSCLVCKSPPSKVKSSCSLHLSRKRGCPVHYTVFVYKAIKSVDFVRFNVRDRSLVGPPRGEDVQ